MYVPTVLQVCFVFMLNISVAFCLIAKCLQSSDMISSQGKKRNTIFLTLTVLRVNYPISFLCRAVLYLGYPAQEDTNTIWTVLSDSVIVFPFLLEFRSPCERLRSPWPSHFLSSNDLFLFSPREFALDLEFTWLSVFSSLEAIPKHSYATRKPHSTNRTTCGSLLVMLLPVWREINKPIMRPLAYISSAISLGYRPG